MDPSRASTGIPGLDETVDGLRLGDNVVWQVDDPGDFTLVVEPFVTRALADGRRVVHVRFGGRPALLDAPGIETLLVDPDAGFETFAIAVKDALTEIGPRGFYVFDPLTDLHASWQSDLMVMNFFKVTCPYLFQLDTIAYFALLRDEHTVSTVAGIRETTQLLLDLHRIGDDLYVQPLKVWRRHSPSMFFPHLLSGGSAISITSSAATTQLFATLARRRTPGEPWQRRVDEAWDALASGSADDRERVRGRLLTMLIGGGGRMAELCRRYLSLTDLLAVASRQIGTGAIGGKAVGMLAARAILEHDPEGRFGDALEPHDSFFVGSDVFVSFLVVNGWWSLWTAHRHGDAPQAAAQLHRLIPSGRFPRSIREQFLRLIEYFGQSPIIVRSSSLLEDNFGNAFAGTYDSVFRTSRGTPDERLTEFEDAVKQVYASVVSEAALAYREARRLDHLDEQMAVLVQRVSGDHHDGLFFPDAAGVANSSSPYVWQAGQADEGMVRLVVGLGTRAVDRTGRDFARIVALADPLASPLRGEDVGRYSQRRVDVLDLVERAVVTLPMEQVRRAAPSLPWGLFASPDVAARRRLRELGRASQPAPEVIDFGGLLSRTGVPDLLKRILTALSSAYDYPVDIEFTLNHDRAGQALVNVVQCRPLQTRGLGSAGEPPSVPANRCLIATRGNFMGGNVRIPIELVVMVRPEAYLAMGEPDRYRVARQIGVLNRRLAGRTAVLIGPGRWGTSMASLGVPTHFTDLNAFTALCETTYPQGDFRPELSYGSHFFQELVETGMVYVAVFEGRDGVRYQPSLALEQPNLHLNLDPDAGDLADAIHVSRLTGLVLHSDVATQALTLGLEPGGKSAVLGLASVQDGSMRAGRPCPDQKSVELMAADV